MTIPEKKLLGPRGISSKCYNLSAAILKKNDDLYAIIRDVNTKKWIIHCDGTDYYEVENETTENLIRSDIIELAFFGKDHHFLDILPHLDNENSKYIIERLKEKQVINITDDENADEHKDELTALEAKIDRRMGHIFGQNLVKTHLKNMARQMVFAKKRSQFCPNSSFEAKSQMNLVITGNPGVGKTEMARCLSGILYDIGVIKHNKFVEVQRADLVGQYIGATAKMTTEKIKESSDGVLFVDEAYTLNSSSDRDFGKEAIETIMRYLLPSPNHPFAVPVFVFAGYRDEMSLFLETNPGLSRRFNNVLHLDDLKVDELASITRSKLHAQGFTFPNCVDFESLYGEKIAPSQRAITNASLCTKSTRHNKRIPVHQVNAP